MEAIRTFSLNLTDEEQEIIDGKKGPVLKKAMETIVRYGEAFGATHLETITAPGHCVMSAGASMLTAYYDMIDELVEADLKTKMPFTVDPRPFDFEIPHYSLSRKKSRVKILSLLDIFLSRRFEKRVFQFIYRQQKSYEKKLIKLGLRGDDAFTCACYLPEVGNTPGRGDILSWAESSAVVYANSVIGARTNRNSGGIDLLCNILGRVPVFGLITDEGRRASWLIEVKTEEIPPAQVLGSAIGMKVTEDTPFISGLSKFFKELNEKEVRDYLKDMGAAAASNGAVGLYHVEDVTPEALTLGRALLHDDVEVMTVTDEVIEKTISSYPVMWRNPEGKAEQCLIGCPHLSMEQLNLWTSNIFDILAEKNRKKLKVETILSAPPAVLEEFKKNKKLVQSLEKAGVQLTSQCPLMYLNNPLSGNRRIITPSNKLRTYTKARYYRDEDILDIISG